MNGWMDGWMDEWMDGLMDGWMDEQIDGWMDRQIDGQIDSYNIWIDEIQMDKIYLEPISYCYSGLNNS